MEFIHAALHLDQYLDVFIRNYGVLVYAMLFAIVFCEMAFLPLFFLPGDPLLFVSGALCATGAMNIWALMALLFSAAVAGNVVNYALGRALGDKIAAGHYRWLNRDALQRAHTFYEKRGGLTFLMSPFIAVVRTFAPFVAGISRMTLRKYLLFVIAGDALWVLTLVPGGVFFGNIPVIREHLSVIVFSGVGLGVGSLLVGGCANYFRKRR